MKVQYYLLVLSALVWLPGCQPSNANQTDESSSLPPFENTITMTIPSAVNTLDPVAQELIRQAKLQLVKKLGVGIEEVFLVNIEAVKWPDASLGCPQPGITYSQANTSGFRIVLGVAEKQYEYHTDSGRFTVLCEKEEISNAMPSSVPTILSGEIVTTPVNDNLGILIDTAKKDLAQRLDTTLDEVDVVRIEKAEWPDTSLGCAEPGLVRRPVAIPGYRIILEVEGHEYVYHTNQKSGIVYCPKG